jgi:rod shape-determining protein MreD
MKLTSVLITAFVALLVQVTLARYTVGGRIVFDFVLVGVVFAALQSGPVAGILAGTVGGLLQDLLAGDVVGVGALAKTLAGCVTGIVGTQFVLARPQARMLIVAAATVLHRLTMIGVHAIIEQHWPGVPWRALAIEVLINSAVAVVAFQVAAGMPGIVTRQRFSRRSSLSRRQW